MGDFHHRMIIVHTHDGHEASLFRREAARLGLHCTSHTTQVNGIHICIVQPSGSKYGWQMDCDHQAAQTNLLKWSEAHIHRLPIVLEFGDIPTQCWEHEQGGPYG